jgi:glycosyltransferase involved in cell wall biosynthesis
MSSLRLAYLVSQYPAINHTYILDEVRGLREQGIEVETISVKAPDRPRAALSEVERAEAAATFYIVPSGFTGLLPAHVRTLLGRPFAYLGGLVFALRMSRLCPVEAARWLRFFLQAVVLGERMRRRGLNRLHVHYSSSVGLLTARIFPVKVSHTMHGSAEFQNPEVFRLREKVRGADFVCAISNYGKSQLMLFSDRRDWDKFEVTRLGVDTACFSPRESPQRTPGAPFELMSVGQLAPAKGQHLLIAALSILKERGRMVRLRLVGDGPMRKHLEADAVHLGLDREVVFEGYRNNVELVALYALADAYVMASFAEGTPVVLMEAMAMGIPCISSRITGVPELIEDGVSGLLVAPADEHGLAAAVERLMDDEILRRSMGAAARERIVEQYDRGSNAARLAAVFRKRISGKVRAGYGMPY